MDNQFERILDRIVEETGGNLIRDEDVHIEGADIILPEGTTIELVVSSGKPQKFVPNVVCLSFSEARTELEAAPRFNDRLRAAGGEA